MTTILAALGVAIFTACALAVAVVRYGTALQREPHRLDAELQHKYGPTVLPPSGESDASLTARPGDWDTRGRAIPHQLLGQVAHEHLTPDDLLACEFDAAETFDRFARAFEDAA